MSQGHAEKLISNDFENCDIVWDDDTAREKNIVLCFAFVVKLKRSNFMKHEKWIEMFKL
jgi:hypothetical protein